MTYSHVQRQNALPATLLVATVLTAPLPLLGDDPVLFLVPGVLALCALFGHSLSSLTTTVDAQTVTVEFRWGRPRRVVDRSRIESASIVRNRWYHGWGLRWIPGGTMFNVWGLDAVHLRIRGARDLRIGTDDPHGLATALGGAPGD